MIVAGTAVYHELSLSPEYSSSSGKQILVFCTCTYCFFLLEYFVKTVVSSQSLVKISSKTCLKTSVGLLGWSEGNSFASTSSRGVCWDGH